MKRLTMTIATNQNKFVDMGNMIRQHAATPTNMLTKYDARIPNRLKKGIQSRAEIEPSSWPVAWHTKLRGNPQKRPGKQINSECTYMTENQISVGNTRKKSICSGDLN